VDADALGSSPMVWMRRFQARRGEYPDAVELTLADEEQQNPW